MNAGHHPQRGQALAMLLLANVFWGLSFPLIKALVLIGERLVPAGGGGFTVACTVAPRFLVATVVLGLWMRRSGGIRLTRDEWRQGLFLGVFGTAGMLCQNDGLRFTSASTSAFLTQFYAILIPVWFAFRLRRNPGVTVWLSCLLVLAGVAILGRFDWERMNFGRGEWETLLCSLFFMVQILSLEHPAFAANRHLSVTLVWFGVEAAVFGVMGVAAAPHPSALLVPWMNPAWLTLTFLLTAFCTLGAFPIMLQWQPKITATEAGLVYCTEPVFSSIFALFLPAIFAAWGGIAYPNESATVNLLLGGGLITLANILIQLRPPPRPAHPAPESTPRPAR